MNRSTKIGAGIAAGAATLAAATVIAFAAPAATGISKAANETPNPASSSASAEGAGQQGRGFRGGNQTPLAADVEAKVKAAAESAVEGGTYKFGHAEGEGYEAHVTKADGTEVEVLMDKDFQVSTVTPVTGRGGMGGGSGETPLTGDDATKATEAAQKAVEGGTVLRVETDAEGTYEAHVRKADGTEVEVKMDKDFKVTSVEEFTGGPGGMRGGHGPQGGQAQPSTAPSAA